MSDGGGFTILEVEWTPLTHDELRLRRSGGVRRNTARTRYVDQASGRPKRPGNFYKIFKIFFILVVPLRDYHGSAPPRQEEGKTENQPPISNRERMYQNICYGILIRIRRVFHVSFFDLF